MSLRDQLAADLDTVFMNADEFASSREFRISDGLGGFTIFTTEVVWDTEEAKSNPITTALGIYLGDVICYIRHKSLPRMPLANEIIYSPANVPWEVLDCIDEEGCYKLALRSTRSQPGAF
jgi:hypothetical protein